MKKIIFSLLLPLLLITGSWGQVQFGNQITVKSLVDSIPASQNITIQDIGSSVVSGFNSQSIITGTPTASSTANFPVSGKQTVRVVVSGTWTGTLQSEISIDKGTTWVITGVNQSGTSYTAATFTSNFVGNLNVSSVTNYRLRAIAAITGTATVKITSSMNGGTFYLANGVIITDPTTQSQQLAISAAGAAKVDGSAVTQPVSIAGSVTTTNTANGTVGSTAPTVATEIGGSDGTNLRAVKVSSTGVVSVDGSATTQPISGSVTANAGTNLNTSALALETGGNLASLNTKIPSQGSALSSASLPVVIALDNVVSINATDQLSSANNITTQNLNPNTGTATVGSTALISNFNGFSTAQIQITGTYTGTLTPQITVDNSNWVNTATIFNVTTGNYVTSIPSAGIGVYQVNVAGSRAFRLSANTAVTGTAVVTIKGSLGASVITNPVPIGQKNQTGSLSVTLSNQNILDSVVTGQSAQTAVVNNILTATSGSSAIDVLGYRSAYIQVISTGTGGTFIFEGSLDNVNFQPCSFQNITSLTGAPNLAAITATASQFMYGGAIQYRYLRLRIATTITGGSIQAFLKLSQTSFTPAVFCVGQNTASNLQTNVQSVGGTTWANAGVAGVPTVGGNVAVGSARTANPITIGGQDILTLVRPLFTDATGVLAVAGPGESLTSFSLSTGAASVTDGTNGKTMFVQPRESDVYISLSSIPSSPTMQLEGSYDNINFSIIPLSRTESTASAFQYSFQAAFTPVVNALYRGKTYGYPIIRIHLTAGTTTTLSGLLRVVPIAVETGVTVTPFGLTAANTTESVGSANGQIFTGGVRTLAISTKGSSKGILYVDGSSGTTGTNTLVVEGSIDGSLWQTMNLQPIGGGATVTSTSFTSAAAIPAGGVWECDLSNVTSVRVRATAVMTTTPFMFGGFKIINVPSNRGVTNNLSSSYAVSVTGATPTTSTNIAVIEAGSNKVTIIKRIIMQPGTATGLGEATLTINRNTIAATAAGTTPTSASLQRETTDAAFSGVVRTGAFTVVGITTTATSVVIPIPTPASTATIFMAPIVVDFTNGGTIKGLVIPVGTTNGIMFTHSGLTGATGFALMIEFTE